MAKISVPKVGQKAPDFELPDADMKPHKLGDYRGKKTVLAFFPAAESPVCTAEMCTLRDSMDELRDYGAQVLGISVDGVWCHLAFAKIRNLRFPLLADFEPKGEVSRAYHAYRDGDGFSERALFVLDPEGSVYWSYLSPVGVNPGADGILRALEDMANRRTSP